MSRGHQQRGKVMLPTILNAVGALLGVAGTCLIYWFGIPNRRSLTGAVYLTRKVAGRYAFPLDTGCGKTQSVVAWCAAVHELRLPYSVAIAASKVEALCDLQRDLISNGVDPAKIGLWHSYRHETDKVAAACQGNAPGFASEPATDEGAHDRKQFLLVTHTPSW
jgi:hypothetical protein